MANLYNELKNDDDNHSVFFVEKTQLLKTINGIYDSLVELTYELEATKDTLRKIREELKNVKDNVVHLKHVLQKDLVIRDTTRESSLNLNHIKMSVVEWNNYINHSNSNSSAGNTRQNSDNQSNNTSNNKFSSITTSNK